MSTPATDGAPPVWAGSPTLRKAHWRPKSGSRSPKRMSTSSSTPATPGTAARDSMVPSVATASRPGASERTSTTPGTAATAAITAAWSPLTDAGCRDRSVPADRLRPGVGGTAVGVVHAPARWTSTWVRPSSQRSAPPPAGRSTGGVLVGPVAPVAPPADARSDSGVQLLARIATVIARPARTDRRWSTRIRGRVGRSMTRGCTGSTLGIGPFARRPDGPCLVLAGTSTEPCRFVPQRARAAIGAEPCTEVRNISRLTPR